MNEREPRLVGRIGRIALALALALAAGTARAERYRVDLILFTDAQGAGSEAPVPAQPPDLARSIEPFDLTKLRAAGIEVLPDESFGLTDVWTRLKNSRRHEPVLRLAWLQKDPPAERGVSLRLRSGSPLSLQTASGASAVFPIDGTVALLLGRFLHLDVDLAYTQAGESGTLNSYRLRERRRLRRDELHHLDSPKLGVLVRVQKAPEPAKAPG